MHIETIPHERDIYSAFIIKSEDLSAEIIQDQLPKFIKEVQENHPTLAVKINVNYAHSRFIPSLKQMGFAFFYSTAEVGQWVLKNGSPMPDRAIISSLRTHVFLIKDNKILVTEQKRNAELIGKMLLPGGNVDLEELPYDAGIREIKEETDLNVRSMQLIGILARLQTSTTSVTDINFFYICRDFDGTIAMQEAELNQLVWVPLETLAQDEAYEGLNISPLYNTLAAHILDRTKKLIHTCAELNLPQPGYLQLV